MDIDLFLFGSAFSDTWKLQRGMVVVLLNPGIFKKRDGKGFHLKMNQNKRPLSRTMEVEDLEGGEAVLEVGFSRDWAGCEALRSDGTPCGEWVDTRHTRICEYHVDQGMKRARKGRMEYAVGYFPLNTLIRIRPLSPRKEKERRNPFAPRGVNSKDPAKVKKEKVSKPDREGHGGGSVFTPNTIALTDETITTKRRVDGIKRELKGSARDRELRKTFKSFAPVRPAPKPVEEPPAPVEPAGESRAFDAKRVRGIGFDPRRRVGEDETRSERKIAPITGKRISLDGVLGSMANGKTDDEMASDSDSDLDIVIA
jgi:hypothetical protein